MHSEISDISTSTAFIKSSGTFLLLLLFDLYCFYGYNSCYYYSYCSHKSVVIFIITVIIIIILLPLCL